MIRTTFEVLILILVGGILSNCRTTSSTSLEREASFLPYEGIKFEGVAIRSYIDDRTGFVFDGLEFDEPGRENQEMIGLVRGDGSLGTATAIDHRGYFLTASHCVEENEISLAFLSGGDENLEKARVVWAGNPKAGGFDLALLHVPMTLDNVYSWADALTEVDAVIAVGTESELQVPEANEVTLEVEVTPVSGRIAGVASRTYRGLSYVEIVHDSPIAKGYSGGPLLDAKGRLLGIQNASRNPILWEDGHRLSRAVRPNLNWLFNLIEKDQTEIAEQIGAP